MTQHHSHVPASIQVIHYIRITLRIPKKKQGIEMTDGKACFEEKTIAPTCLLAVSRVACDWGLALP
jgi:hypothetical protein